MYNSLKKDKDLAADTEFEGYGLKEEYFDKYDGIYTEISQVTRFDESTKLSTTYLSKMDMIRDKIIKAEEKFPISSQGYTNEKLLANTECNILIDTGAVNLICQNHIICNVDHNTHCQSLFQQCREFK